MRGLFHAEKWGLFARNLQINDIYKSEKSYATKQKKLYKKLQFTGSLTEYFSEELENKFSNRAGFNYNITESWNNFSELTKGERIKDLYYDGEKFLQNNDSTKKNIKVYHIIKHYW